MANHPAPALRLDEDSRSALTSWTRSRTLPHRQVLRAQIVLRAADGIANRKIAEELQCSFPRCCSGVAATRLPGWPAWSRMPRAGVVPGSTTSR